jgi:hypothetical protein
MSPKRQAPRARRARSEIEAARERARKWIKKLLTKGTQAAAPPPPAKK